VQKERVEMKKMSKAESKKYKELLLKERTKLNEELFNITKDNIDKSPRDASGDLSSYTYHMADMATDNYDRDFSMGIATEEQKRLFAIEEALKRIADGTYGNCLQCGKRITKKRLDAIPYTELCIECQKSKEKKR
jgi:RNA polymerase-binding protein DksA